MADILSEKEKILVISASAGFHNEIMDFAIQFSGRTECQIVAVNLTGIRESDIQKRKNLPEFLLSNEERQVLKFKKTAWAAGIDFRHSYMDAEPGQAAWTLCHSLKRVSFIITDDDRAFREIEGNVTVPIYKIETEFNSKKGLKKGGFIMAKAESRSTYGIKALVYGIITAALYAAVFTNTELVMSLFNRGGIFAAFPIATVFIFSFAHGAFAGNLWSMLGIEAVAPKKEKITEIDDAVEMAAAA